jgi:transcriptional regulator with XRE-family HTH domain
MKNFQENSRYDINMFMKQSKIEFGKHLRKIRRHKGLTQYQLADLMKISQCMVAHYETESKRPPLDRIKAFANTLNVSIEELTGTEEVSKEQKKLDEVSFSIMKRVKVIEKLPLRDQRAIFRLINSLAAQNNIKIEP